MNLHAVVRLKTASGLPEDEVINTFNFIAGGTPVLDPIALAGAADNIQNALVAFYDTPAPDLSVSEWLSPLIIRDQTVHELELYAIPAAGGALGSPVARRTFFLDRTAVDPRPLPSEVAVCVSYHGNLAGLAEEQPAGPVGPQGDIHPRARRRGRLFIGPLNASASEITNYGSTVEVSSHTVAVLRAAALRLRDDTNTEWCVWSRTTGALHQVAGGWVDNAFDTQRRRGTKATSRSTF